MPRFRSFRSLNYTDFSDRLLESKFLHFVLYDALRSNEGLKEIGNGLTKIGCCRHHDRIGDILQRNHRIGELHDRCSIDERWIYLGARRGIIGHQITIALHVCGGAN
jgi:hypothetical protein